jgi:hypothetical protein
MVIYYLKSYLTDIYIYIYTAVGLTPGGSSRVGHNTEQYSTVKYSLVQESNIY